MNPRTARRLSWSVVGVYFVLAAIGLALQYVSERINPTSLGFSLEIVTTLVLGLWCIMGAVIISHHPRHPVGWVMLLALISVGPDSLAFGYAAYDIYSFPGSLPGVYDSYASGWLPGVDLALVWLAWSGEPFAVLGLTLLFLLFPTGRPLSPRWGKLAWIATGGFVLWLILAPLSPNALESTRLPLDSPLAVPDSVWSLLDPLWGIGAIVMFSCVLASLLSLFLRLRRATGEERQQVKWFVYAAAFYPLYFPFILYLEFSGSTGGIALDLGVGILLFSLVGMAIATGIAMFKYRLYDIDILINKTLVYGALSGTLGLVYFGSVVLLQQVFPAESQISIVLSTLAIAALFSPLRRRIQNAIDKRFYRQKYDAQQTLAAFSAKMRDEVELEKLSEALLAVVEETMQPTHVSLWLKPMVQPFKAGDARN